MPSGSSLGKWYGIRPAGCLNTDFIETCIGRGNIAIYSHKLLCQICLYTVGKFAWAKMAVFGRQTAPSPAHKSREEGRERGGWVFCLKLREGKRSIMTFQTRLLQTERARDRRDRLRPLLTLEEKQMDGEEERNAGIRGEGKTSAPKYFEFLLKS